MNIIKQVAVLIVIGAIAAGGYYGWEKYGNASAGKAEGPKRKGPPVIGVEVAKAEMRKIDTIVEAVGTTRAVRSINVTPLSSGRVVEVGFKAGEPVKANDVLLRLDAEVQRANLTEAEAKLKEANSALKRSSILQRQKAVSEAALERLVAQAEIAKAERDRAAKQLRDKIVRAPFAGSIGLSNVDPGALVKEGEVIAVLDDLSSVEVEFSVPENLFGVLRIGDKV
ncbi:MAG: efflux RND transporter periplasmic adaptor subunit, partial [Rhodospirillaceae bacterium]